MATKEIEILDQLSKKIQQKKCSLESVECLLQKLSRRNRKVWDGKNPLSVAIKVNNLKLVQLMVNSYGFDVNFITNDFDEDWCGLSTALDQHNFDMSKHLLKLGADPNIQRSSPTYSILTHCILLDDEKSVRFLINEMGGDVNLPMCYENSSEFFLPLHYAMIQDLNQGRTNWTMTKLILELGGDIHYKISWSTRSSSISLGFYNFNGSALQFVTDYNEGTHGKIGKAQKSHYEALKKVMMDKTRSRSGKEKSSTDLVPDKPVHELISAVNNNNIEKVRSILKVKKTDVNDQIENLIEGCADGPILLLAVQNQNLGLVLILVKEFQANLNQNIIWDKLPSTILLYATKQAFVKSTYNFLHNLIHLDLMNMNEEGWVTINNKPTWALPLKVILMLADENNHAEMNLLELVKTKIMAQKNKLPLEKLLDNIESHKTTINVHLKIAATTIEAVRLKVKKAMELSDTILGHKCSDNFLTEIEMQNLKEKTEERVKRAKAIQAEIDIIHNREDYMEENELKALKKYINSCRISLTLNDHENMTIDLECCICQFIPEPQGGNIHIFSCSNHHLLCQECFPKITECPVCKENFNVISAIRNLLAERLILQLQSSKQLSAVRTKTSERCLTMSKFVESGQNLHETIEDIFSKIENLENKLSYAEALQMRKQELLNTDEYLSSEAIVEIRGEMEARITKAQKIHSLIAEIRESENYLTEKQIELATSKLRYNLYFEKEY